MPMASDEHTPRPGERAESIMVPGMPTRAELHLVNTSSGPFEASASDQSMTPPGLVSQGAALLLSLIEGILPVVNVAPFNRAKARSCVSNTISLCLARIGTILLIILVIVLLGGFSGFGGGPFYGTGYYGGGGLILIIVLVLVLLGRL